MSKTTYFSIIKNYVSSCHKCPYVDKPYIKFNVYDLYENIVVNTLVISESPPPGNKESFIYNLSHSDRLRKVLSKYFGLSEEELLSKFLGLGIFWDMAIRCRPRSKRDLSLMRKNCMFITKCVIELLKPKKLILLGTIARKQYEYLIRYLTYKPKEVLIEKHPLYIVRFEERRSTRYFRWLYDIIFPT